jgi:hypothetical protein
MPMFARCLLFAVVLVAARGDAVRAADSPTAGQRRCIVALQAAGAQVADAAGRAAARCVRDMARGKPPEEPAAACSAGLPELERAKARTNAAAARLCADPPAFGPARAGEVNGAFAGVADLAALFGPEPAAALAAGIGNPKTQRCQAALVRERAAFVRAEIAEYGRCVRRRLIRGQAAAAADLEACVGADTAPLRRAEQRLKARVAARCVGVAGGAALPGRCAGAAPAELGACLTAQAHCGACSAIDAAGRLSADCRNLRGRTVAPYCGDPRREWSVARQWNEEILDAIRRDNPRPPVHARNLFHLSIAMYDAWAAYDATARPYLAAEHPVSADGAADRRAAISHAAYRILSERYSDKLALGAHASRASFAARMVRLGLDPRDTGTTGDGPAAVGNRIAAAVLAFGRNDGSDEAANYADWTYAPVNRPLVVKEPDIDLGDPAGSAYRLDLNRWQPLALERIVSQNGIPLPGQVQTFIGSQWGEVAPFALVRAAPAALYLDPGPPPQLGGAGDADYKAQALRVLELASQLSPDDGATLDISPAALGNNPLASNAGTGHPLNPATGRPYAPQIVPRGDFGRVLAEYWADGPHSETPPGHWNAIANAVADAPGFERRFAGRGPALDRLEWDVKTYFALNGALHDAAIACWGAKRRYDGVRPITMVRAMAKLGQSSDPALPSYHPAGLPLRPGLVELITAETAAPGGHHADLTTAAAGGRIGDIAVRSWPGSPADPKAEASGVRWVLGRAWVPYQRGTFVTPAFPGYLSGHSTFSRAAAEVLAALTGSAYFPGGLQEFVAPRGKFLIHERGPSAEVRLQWATYFDAADQAGQSRLWGGIHVEADDFSGRRIGQRIGRDAFARAAAHFDGVAR